MIIDDEASIRNVLRANLKAKGYEVAEAADGREGLAKLASFGPNLVVLDLQLPDQNGLQWIRDVRGWSTVPVIVLTATDDEATKVDLLEAGADDYVTKPFGAPEFLARVKVALRHHQNDEAAPVFESGGLRVDLVRRRVFLHGAPVSLTATEYELLRILVKAAGQVVAQDRLLAEIWGQTAKGNTHYVRIYVGQLRKKIETDPSQPKHILTEPGVGYRIG